MGFLYRLNDFGFKLSSGCHILASSDVSAIEEANALVSTAQERANGIIHDADAVYEEERKRGYEEGLEIARTESLRSLIKETKTLNAALGSVEKELAILVASCTRKLVDSIDYSVQAESIVRHALSKMRREKSVHLRCSSEVYNAMRDKIDALKEDFKEIDLIDVIEDPVLRGSRVSVSSGLGCVDCDVEKGLEELEQIIRGVFTKIPMDSKYDEPDPSEEPNVEEPMPDVEEPMVEEESLEAYDHDY